MRSSEGAPGIAEAGLLARARAWLAEDPDPDTRAELERLIESDDPADVAELTDCFSGRLEFGTAGLRGKLGAGPNRMNQVTVIRTAAGLAAYLGERAAAAGEQLADAARTVVIGYDARHKSDMFARDTAAVMTGAGLHALLLPSPLPTPVLAFAIRYLGAAAGVMVTASHNPAQDNGYKVYLGDGSQIVPPADADISTCIDAVGTLATVPMPAGWQVLGREVLDAYLTRVSSLPGPGGPRDLRIVTTALHGVGGATLHEALIGAGFADLHEVPEQAQPDPDFPTVPFPNPEEPGAIDLAVALGAACGADLVLANDPDADRCAVAVPTAGAEQDVAGWRMLRGDEVGALLATHLLRRDPVTPGVFATSIVSSSLLGKIAAAHGLDHVETLTGFKWIGRVPGLRYGYEEALGYCVDPQAVRDKDGISAALLVAELAAALKAQGRALADELDDIAARYGLHATSQLAIRVADTALIGAAMTRLRDKAPTRLGGATVTSAEDLSLGAAGLPPTEGLRYRLADGSRIVVRPSGTEPKLKCYLEVVLPATGAVSQARADAAARLAALEADVAGALGIWRSGPIAADSGLS